MTGLSVSQMRALSRNPRGVLHDVRADDEPPPPEPPGDEPPPLDDAGFAVRLTAQRQQAQGHAFGLVTVGLAALLAEPDAPPPMLLAGLIPRVGVTVLAGPPKAGKTIFGMSLALAAADRHASHEIIGRAVERGPVLYVLEEGSRDGLRFRLHRQASALGVTDARLTFAYRQRVRLDDRASLARLRGSVEALRPVLVILDPLNRVHSRNEDKATEMTPVMDALAGIAYDYACAVLAVHHVSKPTEGRIAHDRLRGSSAIRSGTDANLILDGAEGRLHLEGEFRDAEPLSLYLDLDPLTLLLGEVERPERASKIPASDLLAFVDERHRVSVVDVMARFEVKSKHTALATLDGCADVLDYAIVDGRGTREYFRRTTVQ